MHALCDHFRVILAQFLEHAHPQSMPVFQHVRLVRQGERAPSDRGAFEGGQQQTPDGGFRVNGEIDGPSRLSRALKAIGAFSVFAEHLNVEIRGLTRQ